MHWTHRPSCCKLLGCVSTERRWLLLELRLGAVGRRSVCLKPSNSSPTAAKLTRRTQPTRQFVRSLHARCPSRQRLSEGSVSRSAPKSASSSIQMVSQSSHVGRDRHLHRPRGQYLLATRSRRTEQN